jgi:hypothetical protein
VGQENCVDNRGRAGKEGKERRKANGEMIGKQECKEKVRNKPIGEVEVKGWGEKKETLSGLRGKISGR